MRTAAPATTAVAVGGPEEVKGDRRRAQGNKLGAGPQDPDLYYSSFFFFLAGRIFVVVCGLSLLTASGGDSLTATCRLLPVAATPVAKHRLLVGGLSSCGTEAKCPAACGIFLDRGWT